MVKAKKPDLVAPCLSFAHTHRARVSLLPKQGSRRPWKLYQNYLLDTLTYRLGQVDDGTIEFRQCRQPTAAYVQRGVT